MWILNNFFFSPFDWRWQALKKKLTVFFVRWDQVHDDSKKKSLPIIRRRLPTDIDLQLGEKVRDTGLSLQQAQIWEMLAIQRLWVKLRQCWHRVLKICTADLLNKIFPKPQGIEFWQWNSKACLPVQMLQEDYCTSVS